MTSLLEGARRLVTRGTDIGQRIEALDAATTAARGHLDDALLDDAASVVERASGRLRLSADHTVVAIAGATGSGKSSTFNALNGLDLAAVGVRRPTTSWATACVWGADGADELLDWLGIPERHRTVRDSMLDAGREDHALDGVVLLDLPDHDSTEVSHHLEVDRLVELADLLVWVLDPQKYADAAIHDRYLAPLAGHREVMLVVLNHIDTVPESRREAMLADVRRLLDADGLGDVPVLGVSARHGTGIAELRAEIAGRVAVEEGDPDPARRRPARRRRTARRGDRPGQGRPAARRSGSRRSRTPFAEAAGVPTVVHAVRESTRLRANRATGWPVTSWLSRLKPDPLKRLHLDLGRGGQAAHRRGPHLGPRGRPRCSGPGSTPRCVRWPTTSRTAWPGRGPPPYAGRRPRGSTTSATGSTRALGGHRPRRGPDPGLGRRGAGAAVAADPRGARRRACGSACWR